MSYSFVTYPTGMASTGRWGTEGERSDTFVALRAFKTTFPGGHKEAVVAQAQTFRNSAVILAPSRGAGV